MTNISKIIAFLDQIIEKHGVDHLSAVEANKLLAKQGLLKDSQTRPGLPLRKLLRASNIPHAYQLGGKNSKWRIPHSQSNKINDNSPSNSDQNSTRTKELSHVLSKTELIKYKARISKARVQYKPSNIKCLIIAEAPPNSIERFFYYPHVKTADYLFLGIAGVLYPKKKEKYIDWGRPWSLKQEILSQFHNDGYYLINLLDVPINQYNGNLSDTIEPTIKHVKGLITLQTPIVIIKTNVFDEVYNPLVSSGFTNVINIRIPFPGQGWQIEFSKKFKKALSLAGII